MIIDARRLPGGHTVEADLCVIGAGPAGLTLARELEGTATSVVLLESGRFDVDEDVQSLNAGATSSTHHLEGALEEGRRRQFGGTTNRWVHHTDPDDGRRHARMLLPEAIDLADWPLDRAALLPFYERAHETCRLGPWSYDTGRWTGDGADPWPFERLTTVVCHYGARDVFTRRYRDDAKVSENVTVVLNATAVEIESSRDRATVEGVRAARLDGQSIRVVARRYVLAGGGIENPRLLLASNLGNHHDMVGRFVTDHPEFRLGVIETDDPDRYRSMGFYDLRWVDGVMVSGLLTLREDVKRQAGLKNLCCMVVAKSRGTGSDTERSIKAAVVAARGDGNRRDAVRHATRAVVRLDEAAAVFGARTLRRKQEYTEFHAGWSRDAEAGPRFRVFELIAATEQSPDPDNRLVLSTRRDRLGLPAVEFRWRWHDADRRSILRTRDMIAEDVAGAGLGCFRPWVELEGPMRPSFPGFHHPMGATRMDPDPRHGVVDEDSKVHGVDNLFVAGSSVFPTGLGYANPTLTLVALTTRLADHLKSTT